jgi:thiol-disulfide isomerase/thioredoxin
MKASLMILLMAGLVCTACSPLSTGGSMDKTKGNPTSTPVSQTAPYPDMGAAPELSNQVWLNTTQPLRLAGLRGKVVLLDMWTFDCINCQHAVPYVQAWYQKYGAQGLVVIGNHFPEFDFEKDLGNLKDAVQRLGITYPVDQDNDGATWNAYHNQYWPTLYLIDKRGHIRFVNIGEGSYAATENAINALLSEPAS